MLLRTTRFLAVAALTLATALLSSGHLASAFEPKADGPKPDGSKSEGPKAWAEQHLSELVTLYRHFHTHPELSLMEQETAARLAKEWQAAGVEVTTGVGGHGVVGILKNGTGPTVMLRTDLDALPVVEQTGLAYSSRVKVKDASGADVGVMHACGHDVHITNLIGVARYLAANKDRWAGTVLFIGQPAEERGLGAKAMLDDKLFERFPKPDYAIALHCDSTLAAGKVGCRGGFSFANVDSVDITLKGRGGHGAAPQATIDPIVMAAQLVLSLQTIVSREIPPDEPAVVTVGSIHGGTKHNIISDHCKLQLTVRSYTDEMRRRVLSAIERKAKAVAMGAGAPEPEIKFSEPTPALKNDEQLAARMTKLFQGELGPENVVVSDRVMGGEDFSHYGRAGVPILMYRLGAVDARRLARFAQLGQQSPSLHSPMFYPDVDQALVTGVQTLSTATMDLLKK